MSFLIIIITILLFFGNSKEIIKVDNPNICHKSCKTCFGAPLDDEFMNCQLCFENYFITEDTHSCYNFIPNNYYLDKNILRKCYPNCSKFSSGSKGVINYNIQYITPEYIPSNKEIKKLERKTTWLFWLFLAILLAAALIGLLICCIPQPLTNLNNKHPNENSNINPN